MKTESGARCRVTIVVALPNDGFTEREIQSVKQSVNELKSMLCDAFGGYTSYKGEGGWLNPRTNKMAIEESEVIFTDVVNGDDVEYIQKLVWTIFNSPACEWVHITAQDVHAFHVQTFEV